MSSSTRTRRCTRRRQRESDLIIDALLGTGLRSAPREPQASGIRALNASGIPVLSVDVPSGLDATTGRGVRPHGSRGAHLHADRDETGPSPGDAAAHAGAVWVADIGMPATAWASAGLDRPPGVTGGELVHTSS